VDLLLFFDDCLLASIIAFAGTPLFVSCLSSVSLSLSFDLEFSFLRSVLKQTLIMVIANG
jgi:hypothetical protein